MEKPSRKELLEIAFTANALLASINGLTLSDPRDLPGAKPSIKVDQTKAILNSLKDSLSRIEKDLFTKENDCMGIGDKL